ncbi:MAG: glycyl-radical enzyme activating protein [Calditrichia bacterium]
MNEKGIIFNIQKYAVHDGPGIRTTVFLKGCPLQCRWCHNPESQKSEIEPANGFRVRQFLTDTPVSAEEEENIGQIVSAAEMMKEIEKDILFFDESGGGVTFSGGEPLMQPEFLAALLSACKAKEIHTAVDTCGHVPWKSFEKIYAKTDLFLYDLKLMNDADHVKYTGVSNRLILENLMKLTKAGKKIRVRVPLIPGITDTRKNLDGLADFLTSSKEIHHIDLLPYNFLSSSKYTKLNQPNQLGHLEVQSEEFLGEIKQHFENSGFIVNVGG